MTLPSQFYKPLAIGAPEPQREPPVRLERMIHFVPPQIEKMRAKVPDLISQVDVLLGNLEPFHERLRLMEKEERLRQLAEDLTSGGDS